MEGIWFYWFAWLLWIFITFYFQRGKQRTQLATVVLLLIISAHYSFSFSKMNVSIGFSFLILVLYFQAARLQNLKLLYILVCTFILTFAFVSFQLFQLFDPVWVIFNPSLMVALILTYLVLLLVKGLKERILTYLFGLCHGEVLYSVIMQYFTFPYTMGDLIFFDVVAIGIMLISIWYGIERISTIINQGLMKTSKRKAGIL